MRPWRDFETELESLREHFFPQRFMRRLTDASWEVALLLLDNR